LLLAFWHATCKRKRLPHQNANPEETAMTYMKRAALRCVAAGVVLALGAAVVDAQQSRRSQQENIVARGESSYAPVATERPFDEVMREMSAQKGEIMSRQQSLLEERYDLADRPAEGVTMSNGKPVQAGVRVRLPRGVTWQQLAEMSPAEIRERNLFPEGFKPLPHPFHEEGGMVFPEMHIARVMTQDARDVSRFDVDFDIPEHFLPEFPPPIFLTTRPDLGDTSQGQLVTISNFYELYNGILNPKQLEGLRLLVSEFPQQQFNMTTDRRSEAPSRGVTCFDCHANGHTNAATHLVGDIR